MWQAKPANRVDEKTKTEKEGGAEPEKTQLSWTKPELRGNPVAYTSNPSMARSHPIQSTCNWHDTLLSLDKLCSEDTILMWVV